MALDPEVLAELAFTKYAAKMEEQFPEVVLNRETVEVTRDDGSTETEFVEETGPIEVKREDIMPLLSALSEAVVEHLNEHAEVQLVANGTEVRNIV